MRSSSARPSPTYFGFADSNPDLYEFRTDTGSYVYLHEMECVELQYGPLTRTLRITFDGGPTDLVPCMTVVLTFTDAEIFKWESIHEPVAQAIVDTNPRIRGQVGTFHSTREASSDPNRGAPFHLSLLDVAIGFLAKTVNCEVSHVTGGPD